MSSILVVEDSATMRALITSTLEEIGVAVKITEAAGAALSSGSRCRVSRKAPLTLTCITSHQAV